MQLLIKREFEVRINDEAWKDMPDSETEKLAEKYEAVFDLLEEVARGKVVDVRLKLIVY